MRYCSQCGTPVDDQVGFCPQCGTPLGTPQSSDSFSAPAVQSERCCPRCSHRLGAHQWQCYECGQRTPVPGDPPPTPWYAQGWLWISLVFGALLCAAYIAGIIAFLRFATHNIVNYDYSDGYNDHGWYNEYHWSWGDPEDPWNDYDDFWDYDTHDSAITDGYHH